jgi:hypothetical protein
MQVYLFTPKLAIEILSGRKCAFQGHDRENWDATLFPGIFPSCPGIPPAAGGEINFSTGVTSQRQSEPLRDYSDSGKEGRAGSGNPHDFPGRRWISEKPPAPSSGFSRLSCSPGYFMEVMVT